MTGPDAASADSIEALATTVSSLRSERDGLREAMKNRAVIEQAKGMLAERLSLDPEGAFRHLVERSMRNNTKVAELAATVVARKQPEPPELDEAVFDSAPPEPPAEGPPETENVVAADAATLRADVQLIGTRIAAATTFDELAGAVAVETGLWPTPANVIVLLVEGDGALRLVGSAGLSTTTRGQWDRVPPIDNIPAVAAIHKRAPIFLADLESVSKQFPVIADLPHDAMAAVPLHSHGDVIGVVEITWAAAVAMDKHDRSQLLWLAASVAERCVELSERSDAFTGTSISSDDVNAGLVRPFMDALSLPTVLMVPRYDAHGQMVDFDVERANDAGATAAFRPDGKPTSLMTALPDVGARQLLPAFSAALRDGEPCHLHDVAIVGDRQGNRHVYHMDIQANRLWGKLLVTWKTQSEPARHYAPMLMAEAEFDTGAFRWEFEAGELAWTPGMFRMTGFDPSKPVPTIDEIASLISPADREALVQQAADSLRDDRELRKDLHGDGALKGRVFRIVASVEVNADGQVCAVQGACRDVTESRRVRDQVRRERVAAAAWRDDRDARRGVMDEVLEPLTISSVPSAYGITAFATSSGETACRCWHDAIDIPGGGLVLIVGEVHADIATAPMLRLRHAAVGYATARMGPAGVVTEANSLLTTIVPGHTATLSVAFLDPSSGSLRWSTAGQASPLVVRTKRETHELSDALGLRLGAAHATTYPINQTTMAPGDRLLMYSDSLITATGGASIHAFEALREAAETDTAELAHQQLARREPRLADIDASLLLVRR